MAKNTLPVNFQDDILNSAMGGKRRYKLINNSDGTVSFEDATTYDQVGSNFGAAQLNATNQAVNAAADAGKIIDDIDAINNVTQEGYMAGALALKQVNSNLEELSKKLLWTNPSPTQSFSEQTISIDLSQYEYALIEFARNDNKYYQTYIVRKGYSGNMITGWAITNHATGITCRIINFIDDSNISISDCVSSSINSTGITCTTQNNNIIPLKIYGFNML